VISSCNNEDVFELVSETGLLVIGTVKEIKKMTSQET